MQQRHNSIKECICAVDTLLKHIFKGEAKEKSGKDQDFTKLIHKLDALLPRLPEGQEKNNVNQLFVKPIGSLLNSLYGWTSNHKAGVRKAIKVSDIKIEVSLHDARYFLVVISASINWIMNNKSILDQLLSSSTQKSNKTHNVKEIHMS